MAAFDKMTIWEVERRLETLYSFRNFLVEYYNNIKCVGFRQVEPNDQALIARQELNAILDEVRVSMYRAGVTTIVNVRDPIALGGKSRSLSMLDNLYLIHQFEGDPQILVDFVEQAIGKYKSSCSKARFRTFNPFFWINRLIAAILSFPFRLLTSAGLVTESTLDKSPMLRIPRAIVVFMGTLITYSVSLVTIAEKLGYLNVLRSLVKRLL